MKFIWAGGVKQGENAIGITTWLRCFSKTKTNQKKKKNKPNEYPCMIIYGLNVLPHFNISYICKSVCEQFENAISIFL